MKRWILTASVLSLLVPTTGLAVGGRSPGKGKPGLPQGPAGAEAMRLN